MMDRIDIGWSEGLRVGKGIWGFYRKLLVPAFSFSVPIGFLTFLATNNLSGTLKITGISYLFFALAAHYFIYEIINPKEYYFYYNMGIGKLTLWVSTFTLSSFVCFLFILI
jgi:hypothetical protein